MRDSEHDANLYMSGSAEGRAALRGGIAPGPSDHIGDVTEMVANRTRPANLVAGVESGPLTHDWNAPNGHLIPEYMRGAAAVIDWARTERWQMTQRAERRHEYGAKAVGMLKALLHMGELRECYREQAREIISEWER